MATAIEMPKLGNTVEECLIARWYKRAGDAVVEGETVAEIETDKATFELTAPVGGTLLGTFFKDGDVVPVFTNVCVIGNAGESIEEFRPRMESQDPQPGPQNTAGPAMPTAPGAAIAAGGTSEYALSPRARRFAEDHRFRPKGIKGTGPGGRILEEDLKLLYYGTPRNSSLAAKMIDSGHEARGEGSGTNGMVLSQDLSSPPIGMSTIRERIARRMRESLATTAQYTMNASADATGLISLRARIKTTRSQEESASININAMVMFCIIRAIEEVPEMNVELIDGRIHRNSCIHIGFACDTPKGLLVPVIRDSQKLSLPDLSREIRDLTGKALQGSIAPDELSGGTFTVSNLGPYGIESFSPILNPPQVAILGVNAISLKPVRRNDAVEFIEHIGLSLTCDHQVIDGAPGAKFLKAVKDQIESIEKIAGLDI